MTGGGGISAPSINFAPTGFTSPGLNGSFSGVSSGGKGGDGLFGGGNFNLTEGSMVQNNRSGLKQAFLEQGRKLQGLLDTVRPGFSQFRQAGLNDIENQRQATVSNLADTMAQRRILGSSFANNNIANANAEYDKQRTDFIAKSYLEELAASNQLTQEKYQAITQGFAAALNQLDFESGMAAQMSSSVTQSYAQLAEAEAQMKLQASEFNAQMKMEQMQMMMQGGLSLLGMFGGGGGGGGI